MGPSEASVHVGPFSQLSQVKTPVLTEHWLDACDPALGQGVKQAARETFSGHQRTRSESAQHSRKADRACRAVAHMPQELQPKPALLTSVSLQAARQLYSRERPHLAARGHGDAHHDEILEETAAQMMSAGLYLAPMKLGSLTNRGDLTAA